MDNLLLKKNPSIVVKVILEDTRGHKNGLYCCKMGAGEGKP